MKIMSIGFMVDEGSADDLARADGLVGGAPDDAGRRLGHAKPSRWTCWSSTCRPAPATSTSPWSRSWRVDGVVLVSTPQEIALIDVRRAAAMFAQDRHAHPRRHREHGLLPRSLDRRADPDLRQGRRGRAKRSASASPSSPKSPSTWPSAKAATAAARSPPKTQTARPRKRSGPPRRLSSDPSPLAGEGGPRSGSDEGVLRNLSEERRLRGRCAPSSVSLRLPPSPARGEGS